MRKRTQPRQKPAILSFNLEVYQVPQLQNGVPCSKETVVGSDMVCSQDQCDGVFVLRFSYLQYEPFDANSFFTLL
jgi:hypothetical protein